MLSFEEAAAYLDDVVDELPEVLFRELNGGVSIVPEHKKSKRSEKLYTLGEYNKNKQMGRYIIIYYGSLINSMPNADDDSFKIKLKKVLLHELMHHNESLAGRKDLEFKDEAQFEHYNNTGEFLPISEF